MKKFFFNGLIFLMLAGITLSCSDSEDKHIIDEPKISISKIWIDDVVYEPKDTIVLDKASKVKMEYSVTSSAKLVRVNDYYVYGTSGSLITEKVSFENGFVFSSDLFCNDFMPFSCGFRVIALDIYGGAASEGFYLKLPANSMDEIPGNTAAASQQDKKFGPNQKLYFWNFKYGGRYKPSDVARNLDRLSTTDFAYNYINGQHILFSTHEWDKRFPSNPIIYEGGTSASDAPVTKFVKLNRFTASMWSSMNTNEKFAYLANSIEPVETSIKVDKVGDYYFYKNGLGWAGIINIKALKDNPEGEEEIQVLVRAYKFW